MANRYRNRGGSGSIPGTTDGAPYVSSYEPIPITKDFLERQTEDELHRIASTFQNVQTFFDARTITAVSTAESPYDATIFDDIILADPDTGALVINLPDQTGMDGTSTVVKNIDESGTYALTVNPGANKVEQASGVPTTTDISVAALGVVRLVFDSVLLTWWKI